MPESQFHGLVDDVLAQIEEALDASDADIGFETAGGILSIDAPGGRIIINRQTPNREIWLAAKSGGYHFRFDGAHWKDTRDAMLLGARLDRVMHEQAGVELGLDL